MAGQMRAESRRDANFVGVDVAAMARLIQEMRHASSAITGWLRTNGALPAGVPRTGIHQAAEVEKWATEQAAMLTRRRNYALTELSKGSRAPSPSHPGHLGRHQGHTSAGAGPKVGNFPNVHLAVKAAAADAAVITKGDPVPATVWRHLKANENDPDYTKALYDRLGPAGVAKLIKAAGKDHEKAVATSLGTASHHLAMNEKWLRAMLAEATRLGVHAEAVQVLHDADLSARGKVALGHLGLLHHTPPHTATAELMLEPVSTDPRAAIELYGKHPESLHRALTTAPQSVALGQIVKHATTAHDLAPETVATNADRLAEFHAGVRPHPALAGAYGEIVASWRGQESPDRAARLARALGGAG